MIMRDRHLVFRVNALVFDIGHIEMISRMELLLSLSEMTYNWDKA